MIYVLQSRPPIRAFAVAAALCLVGAVSLAASVASEWPGLVAILAAVVLVAGLVLFVLALRAPRAGRVEVELDEVGYEIRGHDEPVKGEWTKVVRVTTSESGRTLTLHHGPESRTRLVTPGRGVDPEFQRLARDIAQHLDRDRGYGS